jgi:L-methionine (R)-S-oxide reductase
MPIDSDAAFVAEIRSLGHRRPLAAEEFLQDIVRRLHSRMAGWDWVGIYFLVDDALVLGPYVGDSTEHVKIPIGVGVCGTAVAQNTNIVIDDVRSEQNYLACSLNTRSELVVLIRDGDKVVGQFDVDSDRVGAFRRQDEVLLERLGSIVSSHCRAARDRVPITGPA